MDEQPLREFVSTALNGYNEVLARGDTSEEELNFFINSIEKFVPDVLFSDLYYWGPRDMTDEEFVDEVVARVRISSVHGRRGVLERAIDQYRQAIENDYGAAAGYGDEMIQHYARELSELLPSGPNPQ